MNKNILKYGWLTVFLLSGNALAEEKVYTFTVTAAEAQVIGSALGQQPFNQVATLLGKLDAQIKAQDAAKSAPATEPKPQ